MNKRGWNLLTFPIYMLTKNSTKTEMFAKNRPKMSRIDWAMALSNSGKNSQNFEKIASAEKNIDISANFKILSNFFF